VKGAVEPISGENGVTNSLDAGIRWGIKKLNLGKKIEI
jgi:hypothetical protein